VSTGCSIAIEFHSPPSGADVEAIRQRLASRLFMFRPTPYEELRVDEAMSDLSGYSVDENGALYDDEDRGITSPAIGCGYSIKAGCFGRIVCGGRYWSKDYPQGNLPQYAITLLTLLNEPLVKRCWYCADNYSSRPMALNSTEVHTLLDEYIEVGVRL
jgi:hypothetical protein